MSGDKPETETSQLSVRTPESAESVLQLQQQRRHHLSSLARGILGIGFSITILSLTVVSVFGIDFSIQSIASIYGTPVGPLSGAGSTIFFGFNFIRLLPLFVFVFSSFVISVSRLSEIVLNQTDSVGKLPMNVSVENKSGSETFDDFRYMQSLSSVIDKNSEDLQTINNKFTTGATRMFVAVLIGLGSYSMLSNVVEARYIPLLIFDVIAFLPQKALSALFSGVAAFTSSKDADDLFNFPDLSIFKFLSNPDSGVMSTLTLRFVEVALLSFARICFLICNLTFFVSFLV